MSARRITTVLKGRWYGRFGVICCPAHDDREPSCKVTDDPNKSDGIDVNCFAGCDWRVVKAELRRQGLLRDFQPDQTAPRMPDWSAEPGPEDVERRNRALTIWDEAREIDGSPAASYLESRGIDPAYMPAELHRVLRWHRSCPWADGRHGCMIALFTETITGEPRAIHRTAITSAGQKIGRKALGPVAGCVIRLWPDEAVTDGLVIGEGIETVLSAGTRMEHRGTLMQPAWATGFAGNMAKFPVLSRVEALTILVDRDASLTGENAALECSRRWTEAGLEVVRLVPDRIGTDFNNIVAKA